MYLKYILQRDWKADTPQENISTSAHTHIDLNKIFILRLSRGSHAKSESSRRVIRSSIQARDLKARVD